MRFYAGHLTSTHEVHRFTQFQYEVQLINSGRSWEDNQKYVRPLLLNHPELTEAIWSTSGQ